MIPPEVLINGAANTILYEQDPAVRDNLFKLFATNLWLPKTQCELETRKSCLHADTLCRRN
jgi:hypothetical protein